MIKEKKIGYLILSIISVFLVGTFGFMIIEKSSFFDSLYMTVITISSVGYSDILELTTAGRIFNMIFILSGATVVLYSLSSLTIFFIEGEMKAFLKGAKIKKMIKNLENHHIVCGSGSTAYKIIEEFISTKEKFIIIDTNKENLDSFTREFGDEIFVILGSPSRDEILLEAGIKKAKTLISVLPHDADNLFVSLSAKNLNEKCVIITRSMDYNNEAKFYKAGADYIISPNKITASKISSLATRKNIFEYLDLISKSDIEDFQVEFVEVPLNSYLDGQQLKDARIPQLTGLNVIGIEYNGKVQMNPLSTTEIRANSKLMVFGNEEQILQLKALIKIEKL